MIIQQITIPKYILEVKLSEKQNPVYWKYDGVHITTKGKKPLQKFALDKDKVKTTEKLTLSNLADEYLIGVYSQKVLVATLTREDHNLSINGIKKMFQERGWTLAKVNALKFLLIDSKTRQLILANENQAGTPKIVRIKGQDIYSGLLAEHTRATVMNAIKNDLRNLIKEQSIPLREHEFPIGIDVEFHFPVKLPYDRHKEDDASTAWDLDNHAFPYLKAIPDVMQEVGMIPNDDRLHITMSPRAIFCPVEDIEDRKLVINIFKDQREILKTNKYYDGNQRTTSKPSGFSIC